MNSFWAFFFFRSYRLGVDPVYIFSTRCRSCWFATKAMPKFTDGNYDQHPAIACHDISNADTNTDRGLTSLTPVSRKGTCHGVNNGPRGTNGVGVPP